MNEIRSVYYNYLASNAHVSRACVAKQVITHQQVDQIIATITDVFTI